MVPPCVPKDFICVDPERKPLVLDFLMDFRQDLREPAITHIKLCLHCREMAATVLKLNGHVEPQAEASPQAEKSEVTDEDHHHHVSRDVTEDCAAGSCAEAGEGKQVTDFSTSNSSL